MNEQQPADEILEVRVAERTRELQGANRELQNEVARREAAEEALRVSRNDFALLSQQLIQAQEKERRRIAQELHDSVGQYLSAIKYSGALGGVAAAAQGRGGRSDSGADDRLGARDHQGRPVDRDGSAAFHSR